MDSDNNLTAEEAHDLEENTRKQRHSKLWFLGRKFRLTSSRFGDICKATEKRNIDLLCKTLHNPPMLLTPAVCYGNTNESKAISQFEMQYEKKVYSCGLFVNPKFPFLGASPDGLVEKENALIEVKCPYHAKDEKITAETVTFLENSDSGSPVLKRSHNYWFQVQGQLGIVKKELCYFIVFTQKDLFVQVIEFDENFFSEEILPKLTNFYSVHYRPYVSSKL